MGDTKAQRSFLRYWWFRYTLATELYIVEKWEQVTIHVLLALFFFAFALFNYAYVQHIPALFVPSIVPEHPITTAEINLDTVFQGGITS